MRVAVVAASAVLLVSGISTSALGQMCGGALALRVNEKGLDFIAQQVRPFVPDKLDLPAIDKTVVDWPLTEEDARVELDWKQAGITLHDLQLSMSEGALRVQGRADVTTGGPLYVHNPYLGLGTADCSGDVQIRDLEIDLRLQLSSSAAGVQAAVKTVKITIDNDKSVIAIKGCTLGNILTTVLDFLRKHFMGLIQSKVEGIAKDKIAELVEGKLSESIQITKEVQDFVVTGRLDGVETDDTGIGVKLGASIHLKHLTPPPCLAGQDLSAPQVCSGAEAKVSGAVDAMFGAGLSQPVINQGVHAAWRSGMLCIDSNSPKLQPLLSENLGNVASGLGLPANTKLEFALRLLEAPFVRLTAASGMELFLRNFHLRLTMIPPGGPLNQAFISADLGVAVKPWVDPATNSISMDLGQVTVGRLEIQNKDGQPSALQLDPARLQRYIEHVALPVLRERLSASPVSPSVFNVKTFQVELKQMMVNEGSLAAYVDAYQLEATGDPTPPETLLVKSPGQEVGPQVVRITVRGSDARTPASLLRFTARIDGGPWSEPKYGGRIDVTTHGGTHVVEIAAMDHDGNIDPSPLNLRFNVDAMVPLLTIHSRPDSLISGSSASVSFSGSDDRTVEGQLRFTAELFRVPDGGGNPQVVATKEIPPGEHSVTFEGLADGIHRIRITVEDGVGNVTSQDVGFVVDNSSGCSATPGRPRLPASPGLLLILLGVGLLALRLTSSRRA